MKKQTFDLIPDFIEIPRIKMITGILVGLLYSFVFYSFLYFIREGFRLLSVTEDYDIWVLTEEEVSFYNLFFAFISVFLAQSVCFTFWFNSPRKIFNHAKIRKTSIINDQRALNWVFLSWFSKLGIVFAIMFGMAFHGGFYNFSLYPTYNYVFILIVIVLFLQTWNTILLTFKRKSFKWMLYSAIIISILAFSLSRINLIDYKSINQNYLKKNIHHKYKLELPESGYYKRLYRISLIERIYVVKSKQPNQTKSLIIIDNEEIDLNELVEKLKERQSIFSEYEIPHLVYQLHIDKTIEMGFVNQLKNELIKTGSDRVAYAVVPENPEYDNKYYRGLYFQMRIPNWHLDWLDPKVMYSNIQQYQNIIEIKQDSLGKCQINDKPIEDDEIKLTVKLLIQDEPDFVIKFHVNDRVDFSNYFKVVSYSREAINELRNNYSKEVYSKEFDRLDYLDKKRVKRKFPIRLIELTTDFMKMINKE